MKKGRFLKKGNNDDDDIDNDDDDDDDIDDEDDENLRYLRLVPVLPDGTSLYQASAFKNIS